MSLLHRRFFGHCSSFRIDGVEFWLFKFQLRKLFRITSNTINPRRAIQLVFELFFDLRRRVDKQATSSFLLLGVVSNLLQEQLLHWVGNFRLILLKSQNSTPSTRKEEQWPKNRRRRRDIRRLRDNRNSYYCRLPRFRVVIASE